MNIQQTNMMIKIANSSGSDSDDYIYDSGIIEINKIIFINNVKLHMIIER